MTSELTGPQARFLTMRPMILSDGANLLTWRNAEVVRRFSRNNAKISELEHTNWLKTRLGEDSKTTKIFIFEENGKPVGMSRFDIFENTKAEISILVNPLILGRGYGTSMLALTLNVGVTHFKIQHYIAAIHENNISSIRLFNRFGFQKSHQEGSFGKYFYNSVGE